MTTMPASHHHLRSARATSDRSIPPRHVRLRAFRTPVRGHAFAARPPDAAPLAEGMPVELCREPQNPADPLAIAVWRRDAGGAWRLGYLDRGVAARLAPRVDAGMQLTGEVAGWDTEPNGRWRRPVIRVSPVPVQLPSQPQEPTRKSLWGRPPRALRRTLGPAA